MSIKEKMLKTIEVGINPQTKEEIQEFLNDLEFKKKVYSTESSSIKRQSNNTNLKTQNSYNLNS